MMNSGLPHFRATQPGDTYYLLPLNIFMFGMADVLAEKDHLYAHVYHEGKGKKGGNNVASLILKTLRLLGPLIPDGGVSIKELNIVFDNCSGQNKNNHVLRLVPFLVEMDYFQRVNFIFLVVGHAKNVCDHLFNILKLNLRKKDVVTFDDFLKNMNLHESCTAIPAESGDFRDINGFFNAYYHRYNAVLKHHIFTCEKDSEGRVRVRESNLEGSKTFTQDLRKNGAVPASVSRKEAMFTAAMPVIEDPGIPSIKQCEMFNKWRPLIPATFQDVLCSKPLQSILDAEKKIKQEKAKLRKQKEEG
jgi:hypothetical protein